jgi:hypothetical protein
MIETLPSLCHEPTNLSWAWRVGLDPGHHAQMERSTTHETPPEFLFDGVLERELCSGMERSRTLRQSATGLALIEISNTALASSADDDWLADLQISWVGTT